MSKPITSHNELETTYPETSQTLDEIVWLRFLPLSFAIRVSREYRRQSRTDLYNIAWET